MRTCIAARRILVFTILTLMGQTASAQAPAKKAARVEVPPKQAFMVEGHAAFVIMPPQADATKPIPWVWYAPTFPNLPEAREHWMFEQFLAAGMAIAGVNVGESYGSPKGRAIYSALHRELTSRKGFAPKAVLLARSRGGLMLYNWAAENPHSVAGIAGIYPVCNLRSYPGLERACGAYGLTAAQLADRLAEHNPIERLAPLAKAGVPIFHIHGDIDKTVPLEANSGEVAERYRKLGGMMSLKIAKGQGHNLWEGFFRCQELVDFVLAHSPPRKGAQAGRPGDGSRVKDLGVRSLPFVIAETGMTGPDEKHPRALSLMKAQAALADHAEFRGNVAFVSTRSFWRLRDVSPSGQGYHRNTNAETYYLIGETMGHAMINLCGARKSE